MNLSAKKDKFLSSGIPARLHQWAKDEHAVGLDVHGGRITASHFIRHNSDVVLDVLATETYDPALSEKELAHCIRSFWKKYKLPTRTVCTCLHSTALIARFFSYTNIRKEELPQVLSLEAEESLQLPAEKIALSWQLNPANTEHAGEISGTLIAAPRNAVAEHINLIKAGGLYPINVELDCSAVINLYDFLNPGADRSTVCLVNLTSHMASIVILSNGAIFPRIVFSSSEKGWVDNLEYLIENIESALLYYQLKIKGYPVTKLLLTGYPRRNNFMERIADAMTVPVESWDLYIEEKIEHIIRTEMGAPAEEIEAFNLATGLGLGLRHPKREL